MVDKVTVQASVSIRERVNVDKPESQDCGGKNCVKVRRSVSIEFNQSVDQGRQVFMPGADVVRQRHTRIAVAVADKAALIAQAQGYKAIVADDDALQAKKFVEIDRPPSGFADGAASVLDTILRWMLAFDFEA